MAATISWLHLSDIHFSVSDNYNATVVSDALLKCFDVELRTDFQAIDFIFFTGDVASSGKKEEYELAAKFFDRLLQRFALQKDRLYVVPGNHDVDRKLIGVAEDIGDSINAPDLKGAERRAKVARVLVDREGRQLMLRRLNGYSDFINSYFADHLNFSDDKFFYSKIAKIGETEIAIYGLNSAWFCASDTDRNRLVIGEQQVRDATNHGTEAALRIGLVHHPFDWLADFDRKDCEGFLIQSCDFILHGHRHDQAFRQEIRPSGKPFIFASGSLYDKRDLPNACNFVKLDLSTGNGKALSLRYSDEHGGFWSRDTQSDPGLRNGEYSFKRDNPYLASVPTTAHPSRKATTLLGSPADYVEYIKGSRNVNEVTPEDLIHVATLSPSDANGLLDWLKAEDTRFVEELITTAGSRLELALTRSPSDLVKFTRLQKEVLGFARIEGQATKDELALLVLSAGGRKPAKHIALQIPRRDLSRPMLAELLTLSVHLSSNSDEPLKTPRVIFSTSAPFISYPYRGGGFAIEPSEYWQVSNPDPTSIRCVFNPPIDVQSGFATVDKVLTLGTIHMLIPRGEADGGPIDLSFTYQIERENRVAITGEFTVRIVAALGLDQSNDRVQVFEVPAIKKEGVDTRLYVRKGQTVRFATRGIVSLDSRVHFVNADGYMCDELGRIRHTAPGTIQQYASTGELLRGARAGVLLGWIGDWSDRNAFYIGSTNTITADADGSLYLAVNDLLNAYNDNSGSFEVAVQIE